MSNEWDEMLKSMEKPTGPDPEPTEDAPLTHSENSKYAGSRTYPRILPDVQN